MATQYKDQMECPGQGHPDLNYFFLSHYGEVGEKEEAMQHIEKCVHCLNLLASYQKQADEDTEKFFPKPGEKLPPLPEKIKKMIAELRQQKLQ